MIFSENHQTNGFELRVLVLIICSIFLIACSSDESSFQADEVSKATVGEISKVVGNGRNVSNEDFAKVRSIYDKYPGSTTVRNTFRNLLVVRQDWDALKELLTAIPESEASPDDILNLAKTYVKLGRYGDAISTIKTRGNEKEIESASILASSYFRLGKSDDSKAILDENWKQIVDNKRESDITLRGILYFHDKEYDKAIELLNKSLEIDPEGITAANTLSRIYSIKNETEKAEEYSEKVRQMFKKKNELEKRRVNLVSKVQSLQTAFREKRYQDTIDLVNEVMPLVDDRQRLIFYQFLVKSYEGLGDRKGAADALAKAKQLQQK
jgi:tetratricopeptide (TPR) repeat protein